jgi:hypothetical protein
MSDPNVRVLGTLEDLDGRKLPVGVDYDSVTIGYNYRLTRAQALEFGRLFMAAYGAAADFTAAAVRDFDEETGWLNPATGRHRIRALCPAEPASG